MDSDNAAMLEALGWDDDFAGALAALGDPAIAPGRVSADFGIHFVVESASGPVTAPLSGPLRQAGRPVAVGDWVGLHQLPGSAQIRHVLPRRTAIRRNAPGGETDEQVLAANVDNVFLASAVGSDFNPRRIERLLAVTYQSGAAPVVLLMKADLEAVLPYERRLDQIAPGVPVVPVSGLRGAGIDQLRSHLTRGKTAVLIGSSGVGKSTLINHLLMGGWRSAWRCLRRYRWPGHPLSLHGLPAPARAGLRGYRRRSRWCACHQPANELPEAAARTAGDPGSGRYSVAAR